MFVKQPEWTICGEAENGSDGIDKAQKLHPDLIVIDLVMPMMNGIDRVLKRLMPAVPIVMYDVCGSTHSGRSPGGWGARLDRQIRKSNDCHRHY